MKILVIGDCIQRATGFGNQTRLLVKAFLDGGHNVVVAGAGYMAPDSEIDIVQHNINYHDPDGIDTIIKAEKPDVCVVFSYLANLLDSANSRLIGSNIPAFFWMPWESDIIPEEIKVAVKCLPKESIVHLTDYAKGLWEYGDAVIPHAVDMNVFHPVDNKRQLRENFSRDFGVYIDPDATIILNVDRNDHRKRWDLTFDYLRRLRDKIEGKVQLIAHTSLAEDGGYEMLELMQMYGVRDIVVHTGQMRNHNNNKIGSKEYANLFAMSDFRISTSRGEGFGVPIIETYASGCINIVPDNTCYPEVAEGFTIPSVSRSFDRGLIWDDANVCGMVEATLGYLKDPAIYDKAVKKGLKRVKEKYSEQVVFKQWNDLVSSVTPETSAEEYPYGYKTEMASEILATQCHNHIAALAPQGSQLRTSILNFPKLAQLLRVRGVTTKSYNTSQKEESTSIHIDDITSFEGGQVTIAIDCLKKMSSEELETFLDANLKFGCRHLIVRFDDPVTMGDDEHANFGDILTSLLDKGFFRNVHQESKVQQIMRSNGYRGPHDIEVWSFTPSQDAEVDAGSLPPEGATSFSSEGT